MSTTSTDRIERQVVIRAPRDRVWQALADAPTFGRWFGVELTGRQFAPGAQVEGRVTHPGYDHLQWNVTIERMEPGRLLSWRWHPHAIEPGVDYEAEPTTLVVFELAEAEEGTLLTVVESGFDAIPADRREQAFRGNSEGWSAQMEAIERHVAGAAA
jgi:uncharacterized protein YndB with AHSA1/START domain